MRIFSKTNSIIASNNLSILRQASERQQKTVTQSSLCIIDPSAVFSVIMTLKYIQNSDKPGPYVSMKFQ